jgi:hypothetical protein
MEEMTIERDVAEAERLGRFRTWILAAEALLFLGMQALFYTSPADERARLLNEPRSLAWLVWVALLLALLSTGGGYRSGKRVRALLDDELVRSHRAKAYAMGFRAAMASAIGLAIFQMFAPLSGREAVHIIVSAALAAALFSFAWLDWQARR